MRVHDACVVEDDIEAAPGVEVFYCVLDVGFFGDVDNLEQKLGEGKREEEREQRGCVP